MKVTTKTGNTLHLELTTDHLAIVKTSLASRMLETNTKLAEAFANEDANGCDYWQREYEDTARLFYHLPSHLEVTK